MKAWKTIGVAILIVVVAALAIGGALVYRGFRATERPSHFEVTVARGMRNIAIPRRARREKNPVTADAQTLAYARNVFLARCALCHAQDGGGRTQVGQSLYPRAPDLRLAATQGMSDGELHYIIENGVQLTGMPAWGNAHRQRDDDSWKLVLFIRALRPLSPGEQAQQSQQMASAHYVGSAACAQCHADIYNRWKKTPMANIVRDPREHPDAIISNLATNNVYKFRKDQVAFVYGSIWKQRYFTKVGDDYYPLPVQWQIGAHAWSKYVVPNTGDWWAKYYPPDNMKRPTGPTCDGCHSVDYNIHTKQVAEWNVGCERCHGPGSEHVAHPSRTNILNPGHMDDVAASDTCIQCHSQGRPLTSPIEGKYYDWPVGYHAGLKLADYWKLEDYTPGQTDFYYFADGTAHKNRMQGNDFVQSVMYRRGITCSTCHDAHGTANYAQLREPADKLCLECHSPLSANGPREATWEEHTHHKAGSAGSQCVGCHMPAIESEGVPGAFVHAHTFKFISPAATLKYGEPNPCTLCHTGKTPQWALDQLRSWQSTSPWRVLRLN